MKDRLIRLLDSEQLTASKFADRIGVQRSSVSHILSGRNKPSFDFIEKTLKAFPDLNPEWLILGKGDMITGIPDYGVGTLFDQVGRQPLPKDAYPGTKAIDQVPRRDIEDTIFQGSRASSDFSEGSAKATKQPAEENGSFKEPGTERQVVRVVLFYSDHTFASFDPSE